MITANEARKEAQTLSIASPYRQALYITARTKMNYNQQQAAQAAKTCNPKVVKRFEKGN